MLYTHAQVRKDPELAIKIIDTLVACGDQAGMLIRALEEQLARMQEMIDDDRDYSCHLDCFEKIKEAKTIYRKKVGKLLDSITPTRE